MTSLTFENEEPNGSIEARIGGGALLPVEEEWPKNPDGNKMILLMSLPSVFIRKHIPIEIDPSLHISVFTTYDPKDYFMDLISYHGDPEEEKVILSGYTKVVIHAPGRMREEAPLMIPSRRIEISTGDGPTGSLIGAEAGLLQNEELPLVAGLEFVLQIYGGDFPEPFSDIFELSDNLGYLFVSQCQGLFFIQAT